MFTLFSTNTHNPLLLVFQHIHTIRCYLHTRFLTATWNVPYITQIPIFILRNYYTYSIIDSYNLVISNDYPTSDVTHIPNSIQVPKNPFEEDTLNHPISLIRTAKILHILNDWQLQKNIADKYPISFYIKKSHCYVYPCQTWHFSPPQARNLPRRIHSHHFRCPASQKFCYNLK